VQELRLRALHRVRSRLDIYYVQTFIRGFELPKISPAARAELQRLSAKIDAPLPAMLINSIIGVRQSLRLLVGIEQRRGTFHCKFVI